MIKVGLAHCHIYWLANTSTKGLPTVNWTGHEKRLMSLHEYSVAVTVEDVKEVAFQDCRKQFELFLNTAE